MRKVLFLTTLLGFILTSSVWAADISGNWILKMAGPNGEEAISMVIKDAGGTLTVTGKHDNFGDMTGAGTLKGDAITFNLKSQMEFVFTGKVTGNKMAGTREVKMGAGAAPQGGAGAAPQGGAGAAPQGGAGAAPQGGAGAAPPQGGAGGVQTMSNDWTAEKK